MLHNMAMNETTQTALRVPSWTFADRIRKARTETGLDQREFAAKIGVKASTYATYETGRNEPRYKDVFDLAKRVEHISSVPATWLIGHPSDYKGVVLQFRPTHAMSTRPKNRSLHNSRPATPQKAA